jgi:hypothetical protein
MKTILTMLALALVSPFLIPPLLGIFVATAQNRRDTERRRGLRRAIRVHHGGRCTCDLCKEIRHEQFRKASNDE